MTTAAATLLHLIPSELPLSEAEQAEWEALSDEQRLALFDEMLSDPADNMPVEDTMDQILASVRAETAARRG